MDGCVESRLVIDEGLIASAHTALVPDALERRHLGLELVVVVLFLVKVAAAASRRLPVLVLIGSVLEVVFVVLLLLGILLGGRCFTLGHRVFSLRGGPLACGQARRRSERHAVTALWETDNSAKKRT